MEKFDDNRIRLKRPAGGRSVDATLNIDPYRSQVGTSDTKIVLICVGVALGISAVVLMAIGLARSLK